MIFRIIDEKKALQSVDRTCAMLGVSASGYYAWKRRGPSRRRRDDGMFLSHIRLQFRLSGETYGSPRMYEELREQGLSIGRHRIARLMREDGLKVLQKRRFKRTTSRRHDKPVAANILNRDFTAAQPNRKWGADISYIWTAEGWLYLAIVLDLYSRRIVGWATSDRMKVDLASNALERALALRQPASGIIHHSDRGSQYCAGDYRKILTSHGVVPSMSGKGNCYDNAMVETVFKTIKSELIWRHSWPSRQNVKGALGRYIDGFYNPLRRHSALGYKSPCNFEAQKPGKIA